MERLTTETALLPQDPKVPLSVGGIAPYSDSGLGTVLDGLSRGSGKPARVPAAFGERLVTDEELNKVVAKMSFKEKLLSKVPFTKQHKLASAESLRRYKSKAYIKTTAERVLEGIEARKALERELKLKAPAA